MAGQASPGEMTESLLDPYSAEFLADPYRGYRELRDLGPTVWLDAHGVVALPRYNEVRAALADWQSFSSASGVGLNDVINSVRGLVTMDPPAHEAERAFLIRPMTARGLKKIAKDIEAEADRLTEDLVRRRRFDGVRDLAQHIPLVIVSHLVGLPERGRERMLEWASASFNLMGPMNERSVRDIPKLEEVQDYLVSEVTPEKVAPGSWAEYVFRSAAEEGIPFEDAQAKLLSYVTPSLDTTIQAMANAVWLFGNSPDQWNRLRKHPELLNRAINEVLRVEAPVQMFTRLTSRDLRFGGSRLSSGTRVLVMFASANRDDRKWVDPDRFDISRNAASEHLAFGFGQHLCMGQGLARLEMRALFGALLRRVKRFEIGACERITNNTMRGFSRMEVEVDTD